MGYPAAPSEEHCAARARVAAFENPMPHVKAAKTSTVLPGEVDPAAGADAQVECPGATRPLEPQLVRQLNVADDLRVGHPGDGLQVVQGVAGAAGDVGVAELGDQVA